QQSFDRPEELVVAFESHRFEHLDADDLVEAAGELPIIAVEERDAVGRAAQRRKPAGGVLVLPPADRRGRDAAAVARRGVRREAAPARADLEHVVVRAELQLAADAIELPDWRDLERILDLFAHGARVPQ